MNKMTEYTAIWRTERRFVCHAEWNQMVTHVLVLALRSSVLFFSLRFRAINFSVVGQWRCTYTCYCLNWTGKKKNNNQTRYLLPLRFFSIVIFVFLFSFIFIRNGNYYQGHFDKKQSRHNSNNIQFQLFIRRAVICVYFFWSVSAFGQSQWNSIYQFSIWPPNEAILDEKKKNNQHKEKNNRQKCGFFRYYSGCTERNEKISAKSYSFMISYIKFQLCKRRIS